MLFYAFSLIYSPPYTIPLPLIGERDGSFRQYGVRCIISTRGNKVQKISKQYTQKMIIRTDPVILKNNHQNRPRDPSGLPFSHHKNLLNVYSYLFDKCTYSYLDFDIL